MYKMATTTTMNDTYIDEFVTDAKVFIGKQLDSDPSVNIDEVINNISDDPKIKNILEIIKNIEICKRKIPNEK